MEEIRNWKMKRVISLVNKIADLKINQGVLLKELAHSIQAHHETKKPKEWIEFVFGMFEKMIKDEQEVLK